MQRATGTAPPELSTPAPPNAVAHLLGVFAELASARQGGFSAPAPIDWLQMHAYAQLSGQALAPWEWRLIRMLDMTWLQAWHNAQPAKCQAPVR